MEEVLKNRAETDECGEVIGVVGNGGIVNGEKEDPVSCLEVCALGDGDESPRVGGWAASGVAGTLGGGVGISEFDGGGTSVSTSGVGNVYGDKELLALPRAGFCFSGHGEVFGSAAREGDFIVLSSTEHNAFQIPIPSDPDRWAYTRA